MKLNKKNVKYGIDNHHHGLFVKEARLRHGYRLSEVAEEICDASYLSKVESGRLFPRVEVFEKIVKKLDIKFPTGERICPISIFKQALYQGNMEMMKPYLTHDGLHQYEIRLIDFFRCVMTDDLEAAAILVKDLEQFKFHFDQEEEHTYLLFAGVYFFKIFEWEKGKQYLEKSCNIKKEENPYLCLQLAKYYFRVQKACMGFIWLDRAISEFRRTFEQSWVFECDMLWCRESISNGDVGAVEGKIEEWKRLIDPSSSNPQWSDIFNILALLREENGRYKEAEELHLKSIEKRDGKIQEICFIDTIKFYYHRQKRSKLIQLIERLKISELSVENRILVDFYYLKFTNEDSECFENFLKKDAIPYAMAGLHHQNATLYTRELIKFYRRKTSYKKVSDAYYELEKFCDTLNLIRKI